ncbi:MAG: sporulation protein [Deltaproteobacteria bacterium]|nr:sporulation protein [Myxococcales bacterium]MDP3215386.1 sporulation protein [Deltaproteobacteria bacterium]
MGLFDAFGVGGGNLSIEMQFAQAQAGGGLQGTVVFQAGKRAQQITNVTVKVTCTTQEKGPNGVQQRSQDVVGPLQVAGAFQTQPGQRYTMPFQAMLPGGLFSTTQGAVSYRLVANADIDGEVDPGAGMDLHVSGAPFMGQGMMPMGGPGMMPMGAQQMGYGGGDAYGKGDPYAKGGDPYGKGDPYAKGGDPYGKGDPYAKGGDPYAKGGDPYAKGGDPYNQGGNPYAKGGDPYGHGGGGDPYGKGMGGGGFAPGQHCLAQWTDGQFYGVTVVQEANGMFMVQWDDGTPASWVRGDQIAQG